MRMDRFALLFFGTFVGGYIAVSTPTSVLIAGAATADARSFRSVVETYYNEEFQAHPIDATRIGVHDYDAEVDDLSQDGHAKDAARLRKALDIIAAFDPATLSAENRDDREVLISNIKGQLLDIETIRYWRKDPSLYAQSATAAVFNLVHRDFAPLADRLRSVIARERHIPALLAAGKANIEHPPLAFVEIAIRNVAGSINFLKTGAPAAFSAVDDEQLKSEFAAVNDAAVAAFESYKTYLDQELKPKADGEFALGSDLFAKRIYYNEMVEISPDRLLDMAYARLNKDKSALSEAARELNPSAPIDVVLKAIRSAHPTADALIPTAKDDLAGLRAFVLDHHIATIPSDLRPLVEENSGFPARDDRSGVGRAGSFGTARDASILLCHAARCRARPRQARAISRSLFFPRTRDHFVA